MRLLRSMTYAQAPAGARSASAGSTLQPPGGHKGVFDGAVITREVGDHHHVLGEACGHAEGAGEHADDLVAVVEIGPDHQVLLIELPGDEPTLVTPPQPTLRLAPADALQLRGQPVYLLEDHHGSVAHRGSLAAIRKPPGRWHWPGTRQIRSLPPWLGRNMTIGA
jgi:hypothetical protein